jgi:hypothetical protein
VRIALQRGKLSSAISSLKKDICTPRDTGDPARHRLVNENGIAAEQHDFCLSESQAAKVTKAPLELTSVLNANLCESPLTCSYCPHIAKSSAGIFRPAGDVLG